MMSSFMYVGIEFGQIRATWLPCQRHTIAMSAPRRRHVASTSEPRGIHVSAALAPRQQPTQLYKWRGKSIHDDHFRHRFWASGWVEWALHQSMMTWERHGSC
jgi:hypothetical protein